jgi:hypothetical protein
MFDTFDVFYLHIYYDPDQVYAYIQFFSSVKDFFVKKYLWKEKEGILLWNRKVWICKYFTGFDDNMINFLQFFPEYQLQWIVPEFEKTSLKELGKHYFTNLYKNGSYYLFATNKPPECSSDTL